jgi:hypothetical protein
MRGTVSWTDQYHTSHNETYELDVSLSINDADGVQNPGASVDSSYPTDPIDTGGSSFGDDLGGPTEVDAAVTGYQVAGSDLNTIFAGLSGLTAITTSTGYQTSGGDQLEDLFAPLADGTAAAATGYQVNGADLNTLFAARGSL